MTLEEYNILNLVRIMALEYGEYGFETQGHLSTKEGGVLPLSSNFPFEFVDREFLATGSLLRLKLEILKPFFIPLDVNCEVHQTSGYEQIMIVTMQPSVSNYSLLSKDESLIEVGLSQSISLPETGLTRSDSVSGIVAGSAPESTRLNSAELPLYNANFFQDLAVAYRNCFEEAFLFLQKRGNQKISTITRIKTTSVDCQGNWEFALHAYLTDPENNPAVIYHDPHCIIVKDKFQKVS